MWYEYIRRLDGKVRHLRRGEDCATVCGVPCVGATWVRVRAFHLWAYCGNCRRVMAARQKRDERRIE